MRTQGPDKQPSRVVPWVIALAMLGVYAALVEWLLQRC